MNITFLLSAFIALCTFAPVEVPYLNNCLLRADSLLSFFKCLYKFTTLTAMAKLFYNIWFLFSRSPLIHYLKSRYRLRVFVNSFDDIMEAIVSCFFCFKNYFIGHVICLFVGYAFSKFVPRIL